MRYAGIGSRKTPDDIRLEMSAIASELDEDGYTLQTGIGFSGNPEDADLAFSNGSKNKTLFGPGWMRRESNGSRIVDAYTDYQLSTTNSVVDEVHRNPLALDKIDPKTGEVKKGGRQLMARNTYQIFGANLDTPVDFVLYWGIDRPGDIRPDGGTGQAVEMARRKGIPCINMAIPGWRDRLRAAINSKKDKEIVDVNSSANNQMPINVYSGDINGYESLSNPFAAKFTYNGVQYNSIEHAYIMAKLANSLPLESQPESVRSIFDSYEAGKSNIYKLMTAGRHLEGLNVEKWNSIKQGIIEDIMFASFSQDEKRRNLLLSTGTRPFTHVSPKGYNLGEWTQLFPETLSNVRAKLSGETAQTESKETTESSQKLERFKGEWKREDVKSQPNKLFIFTDNTNRTSGSGVIPDDSRYSKKYGKGLKFPTRTAAVVRGLDNAYPVSTQRWYDPKNKKVRESGRWNDEDIEIFKEVIDSEFNDIKEAWDTGKYESIVFPSGDGLFNGRISAISKDRAPALYDYLQEKVKELKEHVEKSSAGSPGSAKNTESEAAALAKTVYDSIGDKTISDGMVISNIRKDGKYDRDTNIEFADENGYLYSMERSSNLSYSNPWASFVRTGTIKTKTTKEAVLNYIEWILSPETTINPERHAWIREMILSGVDKGKTIQYYAELGEPSHATALKYLIENPELLSFPEGPAISDENIDSSGGSATDSPIKENIKPGVPELFESNPDLANAVYEALGFKQKQYASKLKELSERRKLASKWDLENSQLIKDIRVDKSQPKELKPNAADNNLAAIMLYGMKMSELQDKGLPEEMNEATTLAYRILNDFMFDINELEFYQDVLLDNPEYATTLSTNENPVKEFFENDIFEQVEKEKLEITPQQKQQAQQLYSQYLEQNPNGNIEGFKEFVSNENNALKEKYKGKIIYATPGSGKTTLVNMYPSLFVDTDALMVDVMNEFDPGFARNEGESIQDFIFRYTVDHRDSEGTSKDDVNAEVLRRARDLAADGKTILTGTIAFIEDADFVMSSDISTEGVINRFGSVESARKYLIRELAMANGRSVESIKYVSDEILSSESTGFLNMDSIDLSKNVSYRDIYDINEEDLSFLSMSTGVGKYALRHLIYEFRKELSLAGNNYAGVMPSEEQVKELMSKIKTPRIHPFARDAYFDKISALTVGKEMLPTINKSGIKIDDDRFYFVLSKGMQDRINSYLKRIPESKRSLSLLGISKNGFELDKNKDRRIMYKIDQDGNDILYVEMLKTEKYDAGDGIYLLREVPYYRFSVMADMVSQSMEKEYLAGNKSKSYEMDEKKRKMLLNTGRPSEKSTGNFLFRNIINQLVKIINERTGSKYTHKGFMSMGMQSIFEEIEKLGLRDEIQEMIRSAIAHALEINKDQTRDSIVQMAADIGFTVDELEDLSKMIDMVPDGIIKLSTFIPISEDFEAYFKGNSSPKIKSAGEFLPTSIRNLFKSVISLDSAGFRLSVKMAVDKNLISAGEINELNTYIGKFADEYLSGSRSSWYTNQDGMFSVVKLLRSMLKGGVLADSVPKRVSVLSKKLLDIVGKNDFDGLGIPLSKWANMLMNEYIGDTDVNAVIPYISFMMENIFSGFNNFLSSSVVFPNSRNMDLDTSMELKKRGLILNNNAVMAHEIGHAIDMYLTSTNYEFRRKLNVMFNSMVLGNEISGNPEATKISKQLSHRIKRYISKGLKTRGYTENNIKEIFADLFATIIADSAGIDLSRTHLASMLDFLNDNRNALDDLSFHIFKEMETTTDEVRLYVHENEVVYGIPNENDKKLSDSVMSIINPKFKPNQSNQEKTSYFYSAIRKPGDILSGLFKSILLKAIDFIYKSTGISLYNKKNPENLVDMSLYSNNIKDNHLAIRVDRIKKLDAIIREEIRPIPFVSLISREINSDNTYNLESVAKSSTQDKFRERNPGSGDSGNISFKINDVSSDLYPSNNREKEEGISKFSRIFKSRKNRKSAAFALKVANELSRRTGIEFEVISKERMLEIGGKENTKAMFMKDEMKAYLMEGSIDLDTVVHEIFFHPFLLMLKSDESTKPIYNKLAEQAFKDEGIVRFVAEGYRDKPDPEKVDEVIVYVLSKTVESIANKHKTWGYAKYYFKAFTDFIMNLYGKARGIDIIRPDATINDIAEFVYFGNGRMRLEGGDSKSTIHDSVSKLASLYNTKEYKRYSGGLISFYELLSESGIEIDGYVSAEFGRYPSYNVKYAAGKMFSDLSEVDFENGRIYSGDGKVMATLTSVLTDKNERLITSLTILDNRDDFGIAIRSILNTLKSTPDKPIHIIVSPEINEYLSNNDVFVDDAFDFSSDGEYSIVSISKNMLEHYSDFFFKRDMTRGDNDLREAAAQLDKTEIILSGIKNDLGNILDPSNASVSRNSLNLNAFKNANTKFQLARDYDAIISLLHDATISMPAHVEAVKQMLRQISKGVNSTELSIADINFLYKEIVPLYKKIQEYMNLVDDTKNSPFLAHLSKEARNQVIKNKKALATYTNELEVVLSEAIRNNTSLIMAKIAKEVGNSEYEDGEVKYNEILDDDISDIVNWLGSGDVASNEIIRVMDKIMFDTETDVNIKVAGNKFLLDTFRLFGEIKKADKGATYDRYLEEDANGKKTAYLISDLLRGVFIRNYKKEQDRLEAIRIQNITPDENGVVKMSEAEAQKAYNRALNKWKSENSERKFVPEYYDAFFSMSPEAQHVLDEAKSKLRLFTSRFLDENGVVDTRDMTTGEYTTYLNYIKELSDIASPVDYDGNIKMGKEKQIADEIKAFREKTREGVEYEANVSQFEARKREVMEDPNLSKSQKDEWLRRNTMTVYSDEFYERLSNLSDAVQTKSWQDMNDIINSILRLYRDPQSGFVNVSEMEEIPMRFNGTDSNLAEFVRNGLRILHTTRIKGSKGNESFEDFAKIEYSPEYISMDAELASGRLSRSEMQDIINKTSFTHNGKTIIYKMYSKVVPLNSSDIRVEPNAIWRSISDSSKMLNKNFNDKEAESGMIPKRSLYDNSKNFNEKIRSNKLFSDFYDAVKAAYDNANQMYDYSPNPHPYRLGQIEEETFSRLFRGQKMGDGIKEAVADTFRWKDYDPVGEEKNRGKVRADGSKVYRVRTKYRKLIDDGDQISRDLLGTLEAYTRAATEFSEKSKIEDQIVLLYEYLGRSSVHKKGQTYKAGDSNVRRKAEYMMEARLYGVEESTMRRMHAPSSIRRMVSRNGGGILGRAYNKISGAQNKLASTLEGSSWSLAKPINILRSFLTTLFLSKKAIVIIANAGTALFNAKVEAASGVWMSNRTFVNGFKEISHTIGGLLKETKGIVSNDKAIAILRAADIGRSTRGTMSNLHGASRLRRAKKNFMFAEYSSGDYVVKGAITIGVLMNIKFHNGRFYTKPQFVNEARQKDPNAKISDIEFEFDSISDNLYDAIESDGWAISPKKGYENSNFIEMLRLGISISSMVARKADGQLSSRDKSKAYSNAFTRLMLMFRGWMLITGEERFGAERFSYRYGSRVSGNIMHRKDGKFGRGGLATTLKILKSHFSDNFDVLKKNGLSGVKDLKGISKQKNDYGLMEYYNFKKTFQDAKWILITSLASAIINLIRPEDEEDKRTSLWIAAYVYVSRFVMELGAQYSPGDFVGIVGDPIPGENVIRELTDVPGMFFRGEHSDIIQSGRFAGKRKWQKAAIDLTPGVRNIYRDFISPDYEAQRRHMEPNMIAAPKLMENIIIESGAKIFGSTRMRYKKMSTKLDTLNDEFKKELESGYRKNLPIGKKSSEERKAMANDIKVIKSKMTKIINEKKRSIREGAEFTGKDYKEFEKLVMEIAKNENEILRERYKKK